MRVSVARWGRLDLAIHNAGVVGGGRFEECNPTDSDRILDVNLRGVLHGTEAAYAFESLDFSADRRGFEGFVASFPAGGAASVPHLHPGEELLYVIAGALEITAHGRAHRLAIGDAVHFDATFEHSYRAVAPEGARALVVTSRPASTRG